jgi:membrane protein implicated in regulation of membrane protease activity
MGEKLTAWFVTAAVITPVCAACILGPAVFVSIFAGIAGWFGGLSAITTVGLILVAGIAVIEIIRRRRARRSPQQAPQQAQLSLSGEPSDERQKTP